MVKCPKGTRKNKKMGLCEATKKNNSKSKNTSFIMDKIDESEIEDMVEKQLDNKLLLDVSNNNNNKLSSSSFKHSSNGDYEIEISRPETVNSETINNFNKSINDIQSTVKNIIEISNSSNLTTESNFIEELENVKNIKKETDVQTLKEKLSYLVRVFRRFKTCKILYIICKIFFIIAIPAALAFSLPILIREIIDMIIKYYMSPLALWDAALFRVRLSYYKILYADIIANSILACKFIGTFLLGSSVIKNIAYVYNNNDLKEAYVRSRSIKTQSKLSLKTRNNSSRLKNKII